MASMQFQGTETIKVPIQRLWDFIMTPQQIAECAPGYQSMEVLAPDHFKPRVGVGIGAVKATFTLDVYLKNPQPPQHLEMSGRGVAAGSAVDLSGIMDLVADSDAETTMHWTAHVEVTGTIAAMGARLMEGTAQKMTAKFFSNIREKLEQ